MKMSFGKYGPSKAHPEGISLDFINSGYLRWLLSKDWFIDRDDDLVLAVEAELKFRTNQNCHFDEDKIAVKSKRKITRNNV